MANQYPDLNYNTDPYDFNTQPVPPEQFGPVPPTQLPPEPPLPQPVAQMPQANPPKRNLRSFLPYIAAGGVVIAFIIVVLILVNANRGNQQPPAEKVVLQWWGVFMDREESEPLIDEYQTQNSNVTIEYANKWPELEYTDARSRYQIEINRVLKANDPVQIPDIFMLHNNWVGDYERFIRTSSSINAQTFSDTFYPAVLGDFGNNNNVYGVPLWMDTFAILYNRDILAANAVIEPPKDWASFKALAQNLTKRSGRDITQAGFAAGSAANTSFAFDLANVLLLQNGVKITENNKVVFSQDLDSTTAITFFKDFAANTNGTWNTTLKNESAAFLEGDVAMILAPSYRLRDLLHYNETYGINLDIGVSQLPQLQGQDQEVINWPDYWGNVVALNRPNGTESWKFLEWLTRAEQLKKLSANIEEREGNFGLLYPRKDMATELATDEHLKIYNASLPSLRTWYMIKGVQVEALFNKVLDGSSASQSSITRLEKDVQEVLDTKGVF